MAEIRLATRADVKSLSPRLGYGDLLEAYALGLDAEVALNSCLDNAIEAWAGVVQGRVEVIWGVARQSALSTVHVPFLLGSETIPAVGFLKIAKYTAEHWLQTYPALQGYVDVRNLRAQRWLEWVGFKFGRTIAVGPYGRPFRTIWLGASITQPYQGVSA